MNVDRGSYEAELRQAMADRLGRCPTFVQSSVTIEGSGLLMLWRDMRLPNRQLGQWASIWDEGGEPIHGWDVEARADFIFELLAEASDKAIARPDDLSPDDAGGGVVWL